MQLVWSDVLKKHEWVMELMDVYFKAMSDRNTGKSSTHFQERAEELGYIVLTNKSYQKTRFVRALLRGLTAAMRNLPTLVSLLAEEFQDAALRYNNTQAKILEKTLDNLRSAKNLLLTIGMMQLLEIYSSVSLEAQHSFHFPVQVWSKITTAKEELSKLANSWSWFQSPLKLAGTGSPSFIIDTLAKLGTFTPYVPPGSVRKQINSKDMAELLALAPEGANLFDEESQVVLEYAGSVQINGFSQDVLIEVEQDLQEFANDLKDAWDRRQSTTDQGQAVFEAFGSIKLQDSEDSSESSEASFVRNMATTLSSLIDSLPQAELFSAGDCVDGFIEWNKFWQLTLEKNDDSSDPLKNVHKIYEKWVLTVSDRFAEFRELYEICMIRSMSEAMAETVGSIMNTHCGKGRYLQPAYFSMEIVLRFNLGPLHLMDGLIQDILKCQHKDYIRKVKRVDKLVSKDIKVSAAINTFRQKSQESSRFPLTFWTNWKND